MRCDAANRSAGRLSGAQFPARARLAWPGVALLLGLCMSAANVTAPAQAQQVYTVAKLDVEATADNAVAAKKEALRRGKKRALRIVLKRIAPFNSFDSLPTVEDGMVNDLLEGYSVRRERNSTTRYLATLDFEFSDNAVRQLLDGYGIPVSDQQAPQVTLLPVYIKSGKIASGENDPWRNAWTGLDLTHALVPVRLAPPDPSLDRKTLENLLAGDMEAYSALRDRHNAEKLVLAVAETEEKGERLQTRLFGIDHVGSLSLARSDPLQGQDPGPAAGQAASIALAILEGRWKLSRSPGGGESAGPPMNMVLTVQFAGLRQWREMRARLENVPGVQALKVRSLSARTAEVAFRFPGGPERLQRALSARDLSLHEGSGAWILRSN